LIAPENKAFVYALGEGGTNTFWALVQTAGRERIERDEIAANARLISAAPELLEACEKAEAGICDWRLGNAIHAEAQSYVASVLAELRAAIGKAVED